MKSGTCKYLVLMEQLKEDMLAGRIRPGDKLPSENALADIYNISRHTVRKALGILENEGYIAAEHGRGTFCCDRTRGSRPTKTVAVITTYISDYIFPRLIQGIYRVMTENGYSILLKNTGNSRSNEAKCLEDVMDKGIDGLIIEPSKSQIFCRHTHLYERLEASGIPYLFIQGCYPRMLDKPHILMDDCRGGYLLTSHLTGTGHRHIAGIFKADDSQGRERHKGYAMALQEAGLYYDPDYVIWFHTEDRKVKPAAMIRTMLRTMPVDGVVCYNDQIALDVIRALTEDGIRVPEDISVTGYDNSAGAHYGGVSLTTIAHPQEKLGEMAAELLLEKLGGIADTDSRVTRLIDPELIVQNSTAAK